MGFLDDIKAMVSSGDIDLDALKSKFSELTDGLDLTSLKAKFEESGLGEQINSWIGKGENESISADQVKSALGDQVNAVAAKTGETPDQAAEEIAQTLPTIVDKLTPSGSL